MSLYEYAEHVRTLSVCANSTKKCNNNGNYNIIEILKIILHDIFLADEKSAKSTSAHYSGTFIFVAIDRIRMRTVFDIYFSTYTAYVVHLKVTLYLTESNKSYSLSDLCIIPSFLYNVLANLHINYCGLLT